VVYPVSRQINKQKVCENNHSLCAGNNVFVKYQAQGGVLAPKSPLAYVLGRKCKTLNQETYFFCACCAARVPRNLRWKQLFWNIPHGFMKTCGFCIVSATNLQDFKSHSKIKVLLRSVPD